MGRFDGVELEDLELGSDRLLLRPWRLDDADALVGIMRDRSMHRFLDLPDPYTQDAALEFLTGLARTTRRDGTGIEAAAVERSSGLLIGSGTVRLAGDPDIGYWVAPQARGRGYASETTRTLTRFAVDHGLPRMSLFCDVANLASARTALAAGFRFESVARDAARTTDTPPRPADLACFARVAGDPDAPVPALPTLPPAGLGDGVVTLRILEPGDAAEFAETDDAVTLATGFGAPARTERDYERAAARAGLDQLVGGTSILAIVDDATGALAGALTLRRAGPPAIGGIGYVVHPLFRGRGYTARALRLVTPWAFGHGFARLELGAKVTNVASQRAAHAAGFLPDGVMRGRLRNPDGSFTDEARFYLLPPDPSAL